MKQGGGEGKRIKEIKKEGKGGETEGLEKKRVVQEEEE